MNSLPASTSSQALAIDKAIKEMDRAVEFAQENFKINDFEITEKYLRLVENQIHEDPNYYFWTHNRFKHRKN